MREGAAEAAREGTTEAARLVALFFGNGGGAVEAARLVARFFIGGGAVSAASSSAARLRLFLAAAGGGGADGGAGREAARVARFDGGTEAAGAAEAEATGTADASRVFARFLEGGGAAVVFASSSTAARFRLPLFDPATGSKSFLGLRTRWPRPVAEVAAKSSTMSITSSLGIEMARAGRGAGDAGGAGGGAAVGALFTVSLPGDRAATVASTPSGAFFTTLALLASFLALVGFSGTCPTLCCCHCSNFSLPF